MTIWDKAYETWLPEGVELKDVWGKPIDVLYIVRRQKERQEETDGDQS